VERAQLGISALDPRGCSEGKLPTELNGVQGVAGWAAAAPRPRSAWPAAPVTGRPRGRTRQIPPSRLEL